MIMRVIIIIIWTMTIMMIIMTMDFPKTKGLLIVVSVSSKLPTLFRHFYYAFPTFPTFKLYATTTIAAATTTTAKNSNGSNIYK